MCVITPIRRNYGLKKQAHAKHERPAQARQPFLYNETKLIGVYTFACKIVTHTKTSYKKKNRAHISTPAAPRMSKKRQSNTSLLSVLIFAVPKIFSRTPSNSRKSRA